MPERAILSRFFRFWPWLAASVASHGLLLGGWLQPHRPTTAIGATVVVELLNIDSRPVNPAARSMTARPAPSVARKMAQHTPAMQKSARLLSTPSVAHNRTPAAIQVATAAQAAPAAVSASNRPVKHLPVAAQPATKPRQIQGATTTAVVDEDKIRLLLRNHLESFKFYPASARRRNIEGDVDVGFTLTRNGSANQVTVLHGSGYAVLDHAALETVYRAQPFPVQDGRYQFRLRFKRL